VSQKEQLVTELLTARADCREKRDTFRQARGDYEAARKRVEEILDDLESGQGLLPLDHAVKPKKPRNGGGASGAKADAS